MRALLDFIAQSEGTEGHAKSRGYNTTLDYGHWTGGPVDLTKMTLDEIDALQTRMLGHAENRARYKGPGGLSGSSALGRYQIVRKTLRGLRDKYGLPGDMVFDEGLQDFLAGKLIEGRGRNASALKSEWQGLKRRNNASILAAYDGADLVNTGPYRGPTTPPDGITHDGVFRGPVTDDPESMMTLANGTPVSRSNYFDQMFKERNPDPVTGPEPAPGAVEPPPAGVTPAAGAVTPPAGATDEGKRSPYFDRMFEERRIKREGPKVNTTAPAAPTGLDAPPEPSLAMKGINAVRDWVVGDAEYDVPELGSEMRKGGPVRSGLGQELAPATGGGARDLIMGAMRKGGIPEAEIEKRFADLDKGLFLADGEKAMAEMVKAQVPGAEIVADSNGNLYAQIDGQMFSLDKSGWSKRDGEEIVKGLGLMAATVIPAARVGGAVMGTAGRLAGGAIGGAAEQAVEQTVSNHYGGNQPFSMLRVWMGGAFGMGGEAAGKIIEHVGPKMMGAIIKSKRESKNSAEFVARLEANGFKPEEIQAALKAAAKRENVELGPDALARIADAEALPEPVKLSAGQATRDIQLWRAEDMARNTGYGDAARGEAMALSTAQQRALAANADIIGGEFGDLGDKFSRGARLQNELVERRANSLAKVDDAYKAAREAGDLRIGVAPVKDMITGLRAKITKMRSPSSMAETREMLDGLEAIISAPGVSGINIKALEEWRSAVSASIKGAKGGDKVGLNALLRGYDAASMKALRAGVLKGDPNTIGLWRNAVKERARHGKDWESDNVLNTLTVTKGDRSGEVKVAPENVMDHLIGVSTFGGRNGAAREVARLKKVLGAESEAFNQIRAEGLVKLLGFEPSMFRAGDPVPTKLVSNLKKSIAENRGLYNSLYTESQRNAINRLARTLEVVNVPPRAAGTMNNSGTGYTNITAASEGIDRVIRALDVFARQWGTGGTLAVGVVRRFLTGASDEAQANAVRRSLGGLSPVPQVPAAVPGVGASVGAVGAGQVNDRSLPEFFAP